MKKIIITISVLLFVCFFGVNINAIDDDNIVTINNVNGEKSKVSVSCTTSRDCTAIAIIITPQADTSNYLVMETRAVNNKSFSGAISTNLTVGETYTLLVADYDGGPFATMNFVVKDNPTPSTDSRYQVPNTCTK